MVLLVVVSATDVLVRVHGFRYRIIFILILVVAQNIIDGLVAVIAHSICTAACFDQSLGPGLFFQHKYALTGFITLLGMLFL